MIRVLIVDDHPMFRDGLRQLLNDDDFVVVGEAGDGAEALAVLSSHPADVVVMDLHMPRMDGITAITRIRAAFPATQVLVLSTYDTDGDVIPAMSAGAIGYLLKDVPRDDLRDAVRAAARGETTLSRTAAGRLVDHVHSPELLKPREHELLRLVASGATNKEAAAALFVSEATVKAYLLRIYDRLGARDRASAVAEGYKRGLLG
ncbi:response regulator transcription factor [Paractinoplanes lichenicola]|uniref:Response regulator transcription factor n=1 Tax=Paractinoplanes lichenicola TaxID=2802976 RepID=A0ABS1VZ34_9ACTN|nr:response regulator transcription factor [Actinoplanes lichenicola]MBL7259748.1 response regulator transcription factor [Actinoplanes lichenicola]